MALDSPRLDDLTWEGMLEKIRRRIPARSDGHWTLHAPVDPGVTLLETYSWLLEQRLYMLDQTPDALLLGELALLGVQPAATMSSATVLAFGSAVSRVVTAGTEMQLAARMPRLVVTTARATTLLPVADATRAIGVRVDGVDRTLDLQGRRLVRIFPADGSAAMATLVVRTRAPIVPLPPAAPFGLLILLDQAVTIAPSWAPSARRVGPPAALSWWYPSTNGTLKPFSTQGFEDGTGGLRRSGVVRLPIPNDWHPESPMPPGTSLAYPIVLRVEQASWTSPPRLAALVANAVVARHRRRTVMHQLRREWLPLPRTTLSLAELPPGNPEKDVPPIEATVRVTLRERDGRWHRWKRTNDLTPHGPSDRVFLVDRAEALLRFGDGYAGRQPVLAVDGLPNVSVRYWVGGGIEGNIGAGRTWENPTRALTAANVVDAVGGAEAETAGDARAGASRFLTEVTRAVTQDDYVALARTTPGVAIRRAHAALGVHPCHPCRRVPGAVTVFIVPDASRMETADLSKDSAGDSAFVGAPKPDAGALAAVRARLDSTRLVGTEVFVAPARYRPVHVLVEVRGEVGDAEDLRTRLADSIRAFLDPLRGGDGNGWPFGEPVRPSALLNRAQSLLSNSVDVNVVRIGLDNAVPSEACADVAIGEHELVFLASLELRVVRTAIARGGLR
jgi:predicted phage baseplate assembly protein